MLYIKSGQGEAGALQITIFLPFSSNNSKPLLLTIKFNLSVEEVIGYALYEYCKGGRKPFIPKDMRDVIIWNLRMVEDDGEVDEDFPGTNCLEFLTR